MRQFFAEPYEPFEGDIDVTADLKNVTHVDTSYFFALKTNLANLKTKVDKLDI